MLENLKREVLRVSRLAETTGLCHQGGGNFSQIDRKLNLVVITPHAASRFDISEEDMIVLDLEGNVVENSGGLTPSSEWPMHLHIYKHKKDVTAVCHTHAQKAAVFACLGYEVKPVIFEALMYGGFCRVMPFVEPGSVDLGQSAVDGLDESDAMILGHHGLITVGESIFNAYLKTLYVEDVCDANIRAASIVGYDNVRAISREDVIKYRDLGHKA